MDTPKCLYSPNCQVRPFQEAEIAGFRPCKRCQPQHETAPNSAQAKVLAACRYIEAQVERIPNLAELGTHVGMSPVTSNGYSSG